MNHPAVSSAPFHTVIHIGILASDILFAGVIRVARSTGEWAISGSRLNFLLQSLDEADGRNKFEIIETIENRLKFDKLHGEEKGNTIRRFSEGLAQEFGAYSRWPAKILKRKHPSRILWAVISPTNLKEVSMWIDDFIKEKFKE